MTAALRPAAKRLGRGGHARGSATADGLLAAVAMGLAMLTKGPVGVALPALVLLASRAATRLSLVPSAVGWMGLTWRRSASVPG